MGRVAAGVISALCHHIGVREDTRGVADCDLDLVQIACDHLLVLALLVLRRERGANVDCDRDATIGKFDLGIVDVYQSLLDRANVFGFFINRVVVDLARLGYPYFFNNLAHKVRCLVECRYN